jgi:hypothetical protein
MARVPDRCLTNGQAAALDNVREQAFSPPFAESFAAWR